ncbi:hypothetical protein [Pseudomonas sp. PLMAX]|uniref:hypothetical protein n=1 Tax=Pseudomonas sp. PLMAX TaxID=2201998 RepID=UPI0038BA0ACD
MRIQVRGKRIVCIDRRYSINLQHAVEKTVASFSKFETTIPDRVKNLLTPLEYADLIIFMGNRRVELHQAMLQDTARSIADQLKVAKQAIESGIVISADQASGMYAGLDALAATLSAAGFQRPASL